MNLRRATEDDARRLFEWRNDPFIVALGSSRREVGWEEHLAWFRRKLADRGSLVFIIEDRAHAVGQVRFDRQDGECMISVYLTRENTGRGIGVEAIRRGSEEALRALGAGRVLACVREDNAAGRKAFAKAGFAPVDARCPEGHVAFAFAPHPDDAENARLYSDLARRHGMDVRAVDWGSRESQALRFAVLAEVGDLDGRSVLDVGCGLGDFLGWCEGKGLEPEYHGIDLAPPMIELARGRYPGRDFRVAGLLELAPPPAGRGYHYVLASGIFAKRRHDPAAYLRQAVAHMFALCTVAAAFNALSSAAPAQAGEFHADPQDTLAFCRSLTPRARLREGYHPRDFTVFLPR